MANLMLNNRISKALFAGALVLCLGIASLWAPMSDAYAEVRKSDQIMGQTVEELALSVSQCPNVVAQRCILMDEYGTVYFDRSGSESCQIASVTKVMTAVVALEMADLDEVITVSEKAFEIGESSAGLKEGDSMSLRNALKCMMVSSGNDAAEAIAETLGAKILGYDSFAGKEGECCKAFVEKMNETATALGMEGSVFENPHGLDFDDFEGNLCSTAYDVEKMVARAMEFDAFREVVCLSDTKTDVTRNGASKTIELKATNTLNGVYDGMCGVKTGFTQLAGGCIAAACNRGDRDLYAIVLGSEDEETRFVDVQNLYDWFYEHEISYNLIRSLEYVQMERGGQMKDMPVVATVPHLDWTDKFVRLTVDNPDLSVTLFDLNGNVSQEYTFDDVKGSVHAGDKLGTVTFKQHNQIIAEADVIAAEDVAAPNLFEGLQLWWSRLFGGAGEDTRQPSIQNNPVMLNDKSAS